MANLPAEDVKALRTRLHNYGLGHWVGQFTTTPNDRLRIAAACVEALGQFDKYETESAQLRRDLEIQKVNATAVLQAQHERDCAIEEVARLKSKLEKVRLRSLNLAQWLGRQCDPAHGATEAGYIATLAKEPADDVPVVQEARPIARCSKCERVAVNSMAGQRCYAEDACGVQCTGTLFTVT